MSSRRISEEERRQFYSDLPLWNNGNIAFVKHDIYDGKSVWMICNADGEQIAATDNRDFAFIVARQNDLDPQSVH